MSSKRKAKASEGGTVKRVQSESKSEHRPYEGKEDSDAPKKATGEQQCGECDSSLQQRMLFIQHPHPGGEHGKSDSLCQDTHARRFVRTPGRALVVGEDGQPVHRECDVCCWVEMENTNYATCAEANDTYVPERYLKEEDTGPLPKYVLRDLQYTPSTFLEYMEKYAASHSSSRKEGQLKPRLKPQNTEPVVFGACFITSGICKQFFHDSRSSLGQAITAGTRFLLPGSVVLYGAQKKIGKDFEFMLDTCFVVGRVVDTAKKTAKECNLDPALGQAFYMEASRWQNNVYKDTPGRFRTIEVPDNVLDLTPTLVHRMLYIPHPPVYHSMYTTLKVPYNVLYLTSTLVHRVYRMLYIPHHCISTTLNQVLNLPPRLPMLCRCYSFPPMYVHIAAHLPPRRPLRMRCLRQGHLRRGGL
jgi:hypothetical protein